MPQSRTFRRTFETRALNSVDRTVELAFSSEAEVERSFGFEILDHSLNSVRLDRLRAGAALLVGHDRDDQVGVVESVSIDVDRRGRTVVRFGNSQRADEIFQDVKDGIRRLISFGYTVHNVVREGTRNGVDVFRVTDWEPFEISIVSIPADVTVGIGRNADSLGMENPHKESVRAALENSVTAFKQRESETMPNPIQVILKDASQKTDGIQFYNHDHTYRGSFPMAPASADTLSIRDLVLPKMAGSKETGHLVVLPGGENVGKWSTLDTALFNSSRIAMAGAEIIVVPVSSPKIFESENSDAVAFQRRTTSFSTIEAASFSIVADGSEVADSELPLKRALIDIENAPSYGFSVTLTRADMRDFGEGILTDALLSSIGFGLARAADVCLLNALKASDLESFSLAKVAARGLRFSEVSALVGTAGTAAAIGSDGVLRVAGIPAELTPDTIVTIAGAFNRVAIAVSEEITITAKRKLNRDMEIICWANLVPLIPDASAFWKVEAV